VETSKFGQPNVIVSKVSNKLMEKEKLFQVEGSTYI